MARDTTKKAAARKSADKTTTKAKTKAGAKSTGRRFRPLAWVLRQMRRLVLILFGIAVVAVALYAVVNPPTGVYMARESLRLNGVKHSWVDLDHIAPVMPRAVVAAEDANFCEHWGFDMSAIRAAINQGGQRGASTLSQQVVKNVYLWHGRNWTRKAAEAALTPLVELIWSKRRIIEVYLNIAEFDEGIFGVKAAARHYFGTTPDRLTAQQAANLAAVLPSPKTRSASRPSAITQRRAAAIMDGAATIDRDGRAKCFQD